MIHRFGYRPYSAFLPRCVLRLSQLVHPAQLVWLRHFHFLSLHRENLPRPCCIFGDAIIHCNIHIFIPLAWRLLGTKFRSRLKYLITKSASHEIVYKSPSVRRVDVFGSFSLSVSGYSSYSDWSLQWSWKHLSQ